MRISSVRNFSYQTKNYAKPANNPNFKAIITGLSDEEIEEHIVNDNDKKAYRQALEYFKRELKDVEGHLEIQINPVEGFDDLWLSFKKGEPDDYSDSNYLHVFNLSSCALDERHLKLRVDQIKAQMGLYGPLKRFLIAMHIDPFTTCPY